MQSTQAIQISIVHHKEKNQNKFCAYSATKKLQHFGI